MSAWEIKTVEEIAIDMYSGNEITKAQLDTGSYPAIRYSDIFNHDVQISDCRYFVDPNLIKSKRYCEFGDLLISSVSENKQDVGRAVVYIGNSKPMIGNDICLLRHKQNPRFLSYIFSTKYVRRQIENVVWSSTVCHLYSKKIKQIKIPIPSLEEQEKIVKVLDQLNGNLRDLDAKTQELIHYREKQYTFHCNQILSWN